MNLITNGEKYYTRQKLHNGSQAANKRTQSDQNRSNMHEVKVVVTDGARCDDLPTTAPASVAATTDNAQHCRNTRHSMETHFYHTLRRKKETLT